MKSVLYIIVPAYNESENLERLIKDWYPIIEKYNGEGKSRLVIIDDGSKDNTVEIVSRFSVNYPLIQLITKLNSGHGPTVLQGYKYAIKMHAEYIFQTDSDNQTDSNEFEEFWRLKDSYDVIIGHRSRRQDGLTRKFVEKTLLVILRIVFNVKLPDSNAPFRLMKKEILEKYLRKIPDDFNLPNVMLTTYFSFFDEKLKFVEITFKSREKGVNSVNFIKIIGIGWKAIGDFYKLRKQINY